MTQRHKYPRTPYLPWSPGASGDDTYLVDTSAFIGREVVVSEKYDGENTTLYSDGLHARSIDSRHHPSRTWIKAFHATFAHDIPRGWRLCGENLYAQHSLQYEDLASYFVLFSVWDEQNVCLAWDEAEEWAERLGLELPQILFQGTWDEEKIRAITLDLEKQEGYVVRLATSFPYDAFGRSVAKWVRAGHVQTDEHWMHRAVVPNKLKEK